MQKRWQSFHQLALQDNWEMRRFFRVLCEVELAQRESQRRQRYLKEAKLSLGKTLAQLDFKAGVVKQAEMSHLAQDSRWLE